MVFSSITFLFYFLPILLLFYFIVPSKFKNLVLLIFSLLFYFYGESKYIIILLLSCIMNYIFGRIIGKNRKKSILIVSIILNLGLLIYFKYTNFFIDNLNNLFNLNINALNVIMPIGISFFTFQTLSYVVDVYRGDVKASKSFISFACYVSLFPQLIAGPIVRYADIEKELKERKTSFKLFASGIRRFIIGLSKKVLIANVIGEMIKVLFALNTPSIVSYIFIAFGFTIQLYFDFSGYSDMAIGLGKMFGFNFLENFNYPLISTSITEFWRRWHISLSSFFRDYVYIPLGGNRVGKIRHYINILIVWLLTGFWHGASFNFIIWGLFFAFFLILEKLFFKKFLDKHKIIGHIYTIILVVISFIIFSVDDLSSFIDFMKNMLGFGNIPFINFETIYYIKNYLFVIILSIIFATPIVKNIVLKYKNNKIISILDIFVFMFLFILVVSFLIDASFNPFLYFRF